MGMRGPLEVRDASQRLKMPFWHIVRSFDMFFFCWYDVCLHWLSFFFLPPPPLPKNYSLILLTIDILILILILLIVNFWCWLFYRGFICFQFHHSITIHQYIIFFNVVLIIWIFNFYSWSFCKSFSDFQFYLSIQIDCIAFLNLVLIVFIS